ncbi:MAG: radical SAM protein [Actinomycetota bacterium]
MAQPYGYFIQWHLTDRCNLACRHCYQKGVSHSELTADRIAFLICEIREMLDGWAEEYELDISSSLQFTGGEPLLRNDLFNILDVSREMRFTTFLMTNGTLIDKSAAEKIRAADVCAVQVSLEGLPETHDSIRGPGSFRQAADGIKNLRAAGVDVTASVTLTNLNAGDIAAVAEQAADLGASRIGFARLVPEGRGGALAEAMLSPAELKEAFLTIKNLKVPGLTAMTRDPVNCLIDIDGEAASCGGIAVGGCAAGLTGVTIMPDGTVMPCRRMNMGIGNITETPLRDIWADSHVLNNLRDKALYHDRCGECTKWDVCRGCRAVALAVSKADGVPDYLADDPQCFKE